MKRLAWIMVLTFVAVAVLVSCGDTATTTASGTIAASTTTTEVSGTTTEPEVTTTVPEVTTIVPEGTTQAPEIAENAPVYQGMTVSGAPAEAASLSVDHTPDPALITTLGEVAPVFGKGDDLEISVGDYFTVRNEDVYIHVHLSNPEQFEILSFTLNGTKYTSYMFEKGSTLETLILKVNVGDLMGMQTYTIDAIKYVDKQAIKDCRMNGKTTVEILVERNESDVALNATVDVFDVVISPEWKASFTGNKTLLSLSVYDENGLVKELDKNQTRFSDLPANKTLIFVATYTDSGKTHTSMEVISPKDIKTQSEGLKIEKGYVTGMGTCTDTVLYINMPIGRGAFYDKSNITAVYLGNGVTSIDEYAFRDCSSLTSITIGDGVTSIGNYAFYNCWSLTSITIGDGVTSIGGAAFDGCSGLTSITIPDSVTSIGSSAFSGCGGLTSITIPDSVTSIGYYAFYGCSGLTSITIGNGVTSIGDRVFYYCSSLTSITLPNSVTSIGYEAFYGCSSLTSITIPDSVTSIGSYAFAGCSSLTSITIPDSVTSIGDRAFYCCSSLTIYCEAASRPSGWDSNWNYFDCPVVWGYAG